MLPRIATMGSMVVTLSLAACTASVAPDVGDAPSNHATSTPSSPAPSFASGTPLLKVPVDTNDVSILFPLPTDADLSGLLKPSDEGAYGALLSRVAYESSVPGGKLDEVAAPSSVEQVVALAVRVDACYPATPTAGRCESEVRVVFQPVEIGEDGKPTVHDGALHVKYAVPSDEVVGLVAEIVAAKAAGSYGSTSQLGPHPVLVKEGLKGPFASSVRRALLAKIGDARLTGITSYVHGQSRDASGRFAPALIPGLERYAQRISGSSPLVALERSHARVDFTSPSSAALSALVHVDRPAPAGGARVDLDHAFAHALDHEDPRLHSATTTDCASCHLAEGAHRVGATSYGLSNHARAGAAVGVERHDERSSVTNLHSFGYLGRSVAISQRTANESAQVAAQLNRPRLTAF